MKRTDTHRPSVIDPTEYEFVAVGCMKVEGIQDCAEVLANRAVLKQHMERTGGTYSRHEHGGNCHICGAYCIWDVIFYHAKTNTYIRVGSDCAEKLDMACDDAAMNRFKKLAATAAKNRAGKAKAKLMLEEMSLSEAWAVWERKEREVAARNAFRDGYFEQRQAAFDAGDESEWAPWWKEEGCPQEPSRDVLTLADMVQKMITWGGEWTEKQQAFARVLLDRIARQPEIDAAREAEKAAAAPVPTTDKRIKIEGEVLSTKVVETVNGFVTKVLVRTADGWKAWGTRPVSGLKPGDKVSFMARVEPSKDDPKFGFFSRPTKGEVLA